MSFEAIAIFYSIGGIVSLICNALLLFIPAIQEDAREIISDFYEENIEPSLKEVRLDWLLLTVPSSWFGLMLFFGVISAIIDRRCR